MTDSSSSTTYPVYLGVWTNWSLGGRVTGSTITLGQRDGVLLTAFLAVFITFASSRLWRITCFALHQIFLSHPDLRQDGLYHQRQAILRNIVDAKTGLITFTRVLWAWRNRAYRPYYRILPMVIFSLINAAVFTVASIFSSRISSAMGNEVLISSPDCGTAQYTFNSSSLPQSTPENMGNIYAPWVAERIYSYANFAQRCYSHGSEAENCGPYVKKRLPTTIDQNASCPFQAHICRHPTENIRLDTGYLNSQADLGLNAPIDLQYNFRKITHCAPIKSEGYRKTVYFSSNKPYVQYFYGAQTNEASSNKPVYTYLAEELSPEELAWQGFSAPLAEYEINTMTNYVYKGSQILDYSAFTPIEDLVPTAGDTALIFLSADRVRFIEKVDDAWYSAHRIGVHNATYFSLNQTIPYFLADEPASILGCNLLFQVCDPSKPPEQGCSPWGGQADTEFHDVPPRTRRDKVQNWAMHGTGIPDLVQTLRASSLTSRFRLLDALQSSLPSNQWQLEVHHWHDIELVGFQAALIESATGPGDSGMLKNYWKRPSNDEERYVCRNQKIISTAYANFSTLWLAIVLIIGSLIIVIESTLEFIVVWLENRGVIQIRSMEWFSNDVLQLQRMVHEELGLGTWKDCTGPGAIPITEKGELLGLLSRGDPKHPVYVKPNANPEGSGSLEDGVEKIGADISEDASSFPTHLEGQDSADNEASDDIISSDGFQNTTASRASSVEAQIAASTQPPSRSLPNLSPKSPTKPSTQPFAPSPTPSASITSDAQEGCMRRT